MTRSRPASPLPLLFLIPGLLPLAGCSREASQDYADRVEIRRTSFGVPHILAEDLGAMAYGLAWAHMEDYGRLVVERLTMARGELARHQGEESVESDFWWRRRYEQAVRAYPTLDADARRIYEGYAAAVNRFVELHPDRVQAWARSDFTGVDVAAHWVDETLDGATRRFTSSQARRRAAADSAEASGDGSNAWALGPSRTASGHSILVRNPHLSWGAGRYSAYYEAHITVPEVIDFYGDFRVGYPMYFNGGFNRNLGWSTTNNSPDVEEFYSLAVDPEDPGAYLLDGQSIALQRTEIRIAVGGGPDSASVTREFFDTEIGPVVDRTADTVYVVRSADWGEYRRTEQFLRMMQASSLEEWKDAMRLRAMKESNFTYADGAGNIFYVWNAAIPLLPHPSGGDTVAIPVSSRREVWQELVPFDSLPQLLNPASGYLHNENDSFHYTNLEHPLETPSLPAAWPERSLRLRSQLALELLHSANDATLTEVVDLKNSPRMLLADRVKDDLVSAVLASRPSGEEARAIDVLAAWDNTARADSRGAALFELWAHRYDELGGDYERPWDPASPTTTPAGLDDPHLAARAFSVAVQQAVGDYGNWDVAWGDVHRVRWGEVDAPASGCPASLGCFRHLAFEPDADGLLKAYSGDAWILAVEFDTIPRALSILVFGETGDPESPHFDDQTEMFATGRMKPVAFTEEEIEADLVRRYRPGH
ncbi:MAG: penicillin acylase family protein [Candidatus Palauibacterales bacterium]|nr:penicillin acylase family protein [Candidatus Palauibacterales bacterium]